MDISCAHGERITRTVLLMLLAPIPFGLLFTFGGPAFETELGQLQTYNAVFTSEGFKVLFENTYFAYTSYTTIGYGDFSPLGFLARMAAISEAFLLTLMSILFGFSLLQRSFR